MPDFVRAKPVAVPDDWSSRATRMSGAMVREGNELVDKHGRKRAKEIGTSEPVDIDVEDVYTYFETVLSVPEVAEAWRKRVPYYLDGDLDDPPIDPEWGLTVITFREWWLLSRYGLNAFQYTDVSRMLYLLVVDALNDFLVNGDVERAYALIEKNRAKYYPEMEAR